MRRYVLAFCLLLSALSPAFAEDVARPVFEAPGQRPLFDGYINPSDAEMERAKARDGKPGVQDLRWNHSCPTHYPIRREGAACTAPGVDAGGGMVGNACCTRMTDEEERAETCRRGLNDWVKDARAANGNRGARDRARLWYSIKKDSCAPELNEIASQTGRALPVRGSSETSRSNALIAESLGRRPGTERRPGYVDSGGTDDTADYVLDIVSFALGAASIVASSYQPRIGGRYGTRDPGRAPPRVAVPSGVSPRHSSDITGLGR